VDVLIGWPGGDWQAALKLFGFVVFAYLFIIWVASVLWVYKDIRSRTRDLVSQAVGVGIAIVLPILGLPVYLVVRPGETLTEAYVRQLEQEAILSDLHAISACPNCRRPVDEDFQVCAHCATPLREACRRCGKLLQFSWRNCPYCATPRESARPTRTAGVAGAATGTAGAATPTAASTGRQTRGEGGSGRPPRAARPRPTNIPDPFETTGDTPPSTGRARAARDADDRTAW
jgi:RNA polymerase subunit RPABC4/transcription elongation factor Spt4